MQLELTAGPCKTPLVHPVIAEDPRPKFQAAANKDKLSASLSMPPPPKQRYLTAQHSLLRLRRATSAVSAVTCHNSYRKCSLAASHLSTDFT